MEQHRDQLVRRVVHALDDMHDPDSLVWRYFDEDRDAVIQATQQTLEATREEVSAQKVAEVVDRELIDALRFPRGRGDGLAVSLYVHRGRVALGTLLAAVGSLLAYLVV